MLRNTYPCDFPTLINCRIFGQKIYDYDQNFREVSDYAMKNNICNLAKSPKK